MGSEPVNPITLFLALSSLLLLNTASSLSDADALLPLKSDIDPSNTLPWHSSSSLCTSWLGVKQCSPITNRVTKLVLESLNLTGTLKSSSLSPLDQLRVLSFKSNFLFGPIPDLSALTNLKSLYLNNNNFSGEIPPSLSQLHRLKIVVLSNNQISGEIPSSFADIARLYALRVDQNHLSGSLPRLEQTGLRLLNLSYNDFSGEIPDSLARFNSSSFLEIPHICGLQVERPCPRKNRHHTKKKIIIIASAAGAMLVFLVVCIVLFIMCRKSKQKKEGEERPREEAVAAAVPAAVVREGNGASDKGFSWEGEGLGKLVFCGGGGVGEMYSLEDLLKASAETLGRGTCGSTYKAVMESGFIVTVKRLKDTVHLGVEEFRRRMEGIGRLRHPNIVPMRAYFQAKEERLLVYDYFPNGSLFSLIHGSRPSGSGKPLHWTSCLKIAEDVATGLLYLHESESVHGNLKSSNVLLGSDFESCLTDYALLPSLTPSSSSTAAPSLFYRAPESRTTPQFTPQSDVYTFGVLLLELLTGKTPYADLVEEHGADIPKWVRAVREEETESTGDEASEEKLSVLLNIAMACIVLEAERRPAAKEVVRMIREARAEVVASSNSSDHSPGRWSDTVQSLPRDYGSEHLSFAERN